MAALITIGIMLALFSLSLFLFVKFVTHIVICEIAIIAIVVFFLLGYQYDELHTVIKLVAALAVFGLLVLLQRFRVGFWIFSILAIAFWGLLAYDFAVDAYQDDILWIVFITAVVVVLAFIFHKLVYDRKMPRPKKEKRDEE